MLTTELFLEQMNAAKQHRQNNSSTAYVIPSHLIASIQARADAYSNLDSEVIRIVDVAKERALGGMEQARGDGEDGLSQLQSDKANGVPAQDAQASFKDLMEQKKQAQIEKSTQQITEAYDNLIQQGMENPDQQEMILSITAQLEGFFAELAGMLSNLFVNIARQIAEWFSAVSDWFNKGIEAVGDWFKGAARTVRKFLPFG